MFYNLYMNKTITTGWNLTFIKKTIPIPLKIIDGHLLAVDNVVEKTQPLELILKDQVLSIAFKVI